MPMIVDEPSVVTTAEARTDRAHRLSTEGPGETRQQRLARIEELLWPSVDSYSAEPLDIVDARWLFRRAQDALISR